MSFIKFSLPSSTYSVSFRKPDNHLDEAERQARRQREQALPAGASVKTILKGTIKFKKTPRQRELEAAGRAVNQRRDSANEVDAAAAGANRDNGSSSSEASVNFNNLLGRWTYQDGIGDQETVGRVATATALLNGTAEFAPSADGRNAIRVTVGSDVFVPEDHRIALANLGIVIVRASAESGSNVPAGLSAPKTQSVPNPTNPDPDNARVGNVEVRPNINFNRGDPSRTTSKPFLHIQKWMAEERITNEETSHRQMLVDRYTQGLLSGERFDLDVSDLRRLTSLPALRKTVKSITVTRGQFAQDIIKALRRTGILITEREPGSVWGPTFAGTQLVPASQSGVGAADTDAATAAATAAVPGSNRDLLRAVLDSWVYAEDDGEAQYRFNAAQDLMQQVADADLSQGEGNTLRLRIAADVGLPQDLEIAFNVRGITVDRLPAAGGSGTAGVARSERLPDSVQPQVGSESIGINAGRVSPKPEDNPGVRRTVVLRGLPRQYRSLLSAWFEEAGVPAEEVARRRQSGDEIVGLIRQTSREARENSGNTNLDLRNLGDFSSPPPIPTNAKVVTVRPEQFPERHLQALRNLGVTIEVREASALTATERDNWFAHLQSWASLGSERESVDRTRAGTRILAFLEQGNLNQTLDLSGLNISDLPGNLFPNEDTSRYVRSVNLHSTGVHAAILDFLQANGIALSIDSARK
ncbi:hypothetical protein [Noviherbaspirillum malthae]|uniref:hypothetical protein n=1 Tax=Noviherbaspirillum malthae TaxID=1260987 RepID=UPI00188F8E62|nr:hypothetical protein [Noviherbaspirillum malthae]